MDFFKDLDSHVPVQVIDVPKILPEDVPVRAVLRATQLAEQLVEVPTIVSYASLSLSQALLEYRQRTVEQNDDIPAVGGSELVKVFLVHSQDRVQQRSSSDCRADR